MHFHAYQSIPDSTGQYVLSKKQQTLLFRQTQWVALEKVHGANFSVYHQPSTCQTRFAKRTALLDEDDYFYGWQVLRDELSSRVVDLATFVLPSLSSSPSNTAYVIVYGELCGKFYPENAEQWRGAREANRVDAKLECIVPVDERAVQEGVYYCNNLSFVVFDVALVTEDNIPRFLDHDEAVDAATRAGFTCIKPVVRGTYTQVQAFPFGSFDSTLGVQALGMPALPAGTNLAEGVVIKPVKTIIVSDGKGRQLRCMVKLKRGEFSDMGGAFDDSPTLTPRMRLLFMINNTRVASLLSKHTERVTEKNLMTLTELLVEDVLQDFYSHWPSLASQSRGWEDDVVALRSRCNDLLKSTICAC